MKKWTIFSEGGLSIEVLNLGGIIRSIKTPDRNGIFEDVVLGFEDPNHYLGEHPYFGAVVGRFANRIAHGKFTLEGKEYSLAQNNGTNHLHGGLSGFDKVFWEVQPLKNENGIQLSYTSKDGEEGYPGKLSITVTYVLTDDNTLQVKYQAHTDKTTVINLTQHSYFNLSGDLKQRQKLQNLVFPSGLGYDKSNDRVRTPKVNAIFGSIPILSKEISNIKKGEPIPVNQFSGLVTSAGFKPATF